MQVADQPTEDRRAGVLLGYQQRWVADRSPVKACEKSRRVGLTWAEAADSTLDAAEAEGQDTWYIGYNKEMAQEFVLDCAEWARHYHLAAGEMEEFVFEDGDRSIKAFQIVFASGNRVTALSSRPNNLRGKQGKVIIDEAAFHDDLPGLLKAAMALLMWGGRVSIISTHDGDDNYFNEILKESRLGKLPYSVHRITLDDALKDGLYKAICQKTGKQWSKEAETEWREELIAFYGDDADEELHVIPSKGTGIYFSRALLESNMSDEYPVLTWVCKEGFEQEPDHVRERECDDWLVANVLPELQKIEPWEKCWLGKDFGRSGDLSIQWPLIENKNLTYRVPFLIELSNVPFKQQEQILFYVCDYFRDKARLMGIALDSRGNGEYLGEVAMQRYGKNRVEQVKLTIQIYGEWMPKYKDVYVEKSWTIPKDADVVDDHRQVKMEKGIAKVPDTGRTKSKKGLQRHGDSAIAGMLAAYARETLECDEFDYETVNKREFEIKGAY
ncbi:MAG: hypothetical protein G3M70_07240 [Candidatus Nitronauta litoralis]|uniref:Mu-like prophage FluMu protein gp28 n=1 Tax=Candidatus Nitronauta litoralis TaxID=2705533 RepID=A0A7T0BVF2_9BACT|nr:MAG: hypothetical protein G3M70_07240 [Candidatus Nitronauta litoralis]